MGQSLFALIRRRLATSGGSSLLVLASAAVLAACDAPMVSTQAKSRAYQQEVPEYLVDGSLTILASQGGYGAIGAAVGDAISPQLSQLIQTTGAADQRRFAGNPLGLAQARTVASSLALGAGFSDITGTAKEITGTIDQAKLHAAEAWTVVEHALGQEVGASGFGFTNGQRAYLAKAIGNPHIRYEATPADRAAAQPILRIYQPANSAKHMILSWPLSGHPVAGLNAHGLAMTVTSVRGGSPSLHGHMPFEYRRILQGATNVDHALRRLYSVSKRDTGAIVTLADRSGALAKVECSTEYCVEVDRFSGDSGLIAHAAHATASIGPGQDIGVAAESAARALSLESALEQAQGRLFDANGAVEVLRHMGTSGAHNDTVVANARVSAGVVLDPHSRTMWISNGLAPTATLSSYVEVGLNGPTGNRIEALGVNPKTSEAYAALAQAESLYRAGRYREALGRVDAMPVISAIDRRRLSYFRGLNLSALGQYQAAADALINASNQSANPGLAVQALLLRAWNFQQLGQDEHVERSFNQAKRLTIPGGMDPGTALDIRQGRVRQTLSAFPTMLQL